MNLTITMNIIICNEYLATFELGSCTKVFIKSLSTQLHQIATVAYKVQFVGAGLCTLQLHIRHHYQLNTFFI